MNQDNPFEYAELHCISNFSFQRGASHPEELVERAQNLGYKAIAITDECSFAGLGRAYAAAKKLDIKLIVGSEFALGGFCVVLLAQSKSAYQELSQLITQARRNAAKGAYNITFEEILTSVKHCLAIVIPELTVNNESFTALLPQFKKLKAAFFQRIWLGLQRQLTANDAVIERALIKISNLLNIPIVAVGSVDMHVPGRQPLRDVLTAIRLHTNVHELSGRQAINGEGHLRSANKLKSLYKQSYLDETINIANQCNFSMSELRYEYPKDLVPDGWNAYDYLSSKIDEGAALRYPQGVPKTVQELIKHELEIIAYLRYEHYFLTVWDLVRFARSKNILCQGRGSAANSAICYCLHITEVNPANSHLLFERFLSKERDEPPDIDVDFEHSRREEVIQYIYQRYGRHRAALAATVIRYRAKSAIRDVGKALGYEEHYLSRIIQQLDRRDKEHPWLEQLSGLEAAQTSHLFQIFIRLVEEILGFPRHLSQHVGGFVIAAEQVDKLVPVENAAMAERTIIQWDKEDLESLGLLKIDVLALGMLTAIRKSLSMITSKKGTSWSLANIPREDAKTYKMLQEGDSVGVFQVESRAQINMLPRLRPNCFYDLVVQVAIVRPGPIQGGMVHPYLKHRKDATLISYPSPEVKAVLERTLGVPIFQEQVIKLAMVAAGFSAGEADQLRRAMGAWKRTGQLKPFQIKLKEGMLERGYEAAFADQLCLQIQGFGEYGFPESHAASFALLVYFSAWLKCHEPVIFCCALLNSQPMGFYSPSQLVQDLTRHAGVVLPICVNHSYWDHSVEYLPHLPTESQQGQLRLGFRLINGLSRKAVESLLYARQKCAFSSVSDFLSRVTLNTRDREALASAGAFESLSGNRHQTRWQMLGHQSPTALPLELNQSDQSIKLAEPTEVQNVQEDLVRVGVTLGRHIMTIIRERGACYRCTPSSELAHQKHGSLVRVAGVVTGRQRPGTASGVTFMTLEDEFGNINVVVWQATAKAQRVAFLRATLLEVHGILEREGNIVHIVAGQLIDRTTVWKKLLSREADNADSESDWYNLITSRDFH